MLTQQQITDNILWVGASDRRLELFENMFPLPNGVSYNSYLILDDKTALLDTVDTGVTRPYLENVASALNGRSLDYLVLHHMEPDHCANIEAIAERYPDAKLVGNKKTFELFEQFYHSDLKDRYHIVSEGDELSLGSHTLRFIFAPMVHWPEVMFSYEVSEEILFAADAFGTFGALSGNLFDDEMDYLHNFLNESRRYYANIVGKFGTPVQMVLKKVADLPISMIAPLHGPILRENIKIMMDKYDRWSSYTPERPGVVIAYGSMYGNTAEAADQLASLLSQRGVKDIKVYDVSKTHASYIIADVFQYSHFVAAAPTYNLGIFYPMSTLLQEMAALNLQKRSYSIIGNGSWSPTAGKQMEDILSRMPSMEKVGETLEITSSLSSEDLPKLKTLADAIAEKVKAS